LDLPRIGFAPPRLQPGNRLEPWYSLTTFYTNNFYFRNYNHGDDAGLEIAPDIFKKAGIYASGTYVQKGSLN